MELLSYPLPSFMAQGAGTSQRERQQHYGVRLRVAGTKNVSAPSIYIKVMPDHFWRALEIAPACCPSGSGWTPPLALDVVDVGAGAQAGAAAPVGNTRPIQIQAVVREYGVVHEIVARLELTPYRNSQVRGRGRCWRVLASY